jgi:uncharacterized protein (DUF3084 family)
MATGGDGLGALFAIGGVVVAGVAMGESAKRAEQLARQTNTIGKLEGDVARAAAALRARDGLLRQKDLLVDQMSLKIAGLDSTVTRVSRERDQARAEAQDALVKLASEKKSSAQRIVALEAELAKVKAAAPAAAKKTTT